MPNSERRMVLRQHDSVFVKWILESRRGEGGHLKGGSSYLVNVFLAWQVTLCILACCLARLKNSFGDNILFHVNSTDDVDELFRISPRFWPNYVQVGEKMYNMQNAKNGLRVNENRCSEQLTDVFTFADTQLPSYTDLEILQRENVSRLRRSWLFWMLKVILHAHARFHFF